MTPEQLVAIAVGAVVVAVVGLLVRRLERRMDSVDASLGRLEVLCYRVQVLEGGVAALEDAVEALKLEHARNHGNCAPGRLQ